jgi:hypothetical protein
VSATRELIDQLTRDGLTDPERLWEYLAEQGGLGKLPADAAETAEMLVRDGLLTAYQAEQLLTGTGKPLVVAGYRLLEPLGERTYFGERSNGQRAVIQIGRGDAARPITRPHANLVPIVDYERSDGQLFVLREYIPGRSLEERIEEEGALAPVPAARALLDVARGLSHLHAAGLGHGRVQADQCIEDERGCTRLLPGVGGNPESDLAEFGELLAWVTGGQPLPTALQAVAKGMGSAEQVIATLEGWLREVAPPPLVEPKRSSSQAMLRRPELDGTEEPSDDLLAEERSLGKMEPSTAIASVIAMLAFVAAAVLWWLMG